MQTHPLIHEDFPPGIRIVHTASLRLPWAFALALLISLIAILAAPRASAAFGLTDDGKAFVVDSGAGLVFKVSKTNGNIISLRYKGGAELQSKKGSHIASGFGGCAVKGEMAGSDLVKITLATDARNEGTKEITHYFIVRKGLNHIYMATFPKNEPRVGELRWITRLEQDPFPNRPAPSDMRGSTGPIESKDVFGMPDGTTRSKYYGDSLTHGKDRAMDLTYCGVSGPGVGVWIIYGNRESSSGGPFHRDIQNQGTEVYNYMNSGHNMTEPSRLNVLHGPYTLVFTDGEPPKLPVDTSWMDKAGLDLIGYVPAAERGTAGGVARGVPAGLQGVVGFSNLSAQYWATAAADGTYSSPRMKPGTYEVKLYQGELVVGSGTVSVIAGGNARLDLTATPLPPAIFKIGEWDGTPRGFLNGDKLVTMHPSDKRMSLWEPTTFTVGVDPVETFPALQLRKVNSPTTIRFDLTNKQIADHTLRIGITCGQRASRPAIKVNQWTPKKPQDPVNQPDSRSYTIGTYRGNNATYLYRIPASAFVVGTNTLTIDVLSGFKDSDRWLSAGWVFDAVQLDAEPATGKVH